MPLPQHAGEREGPLHRHRPAGRQQPDLGGVAVAQQVAGRGQLLRQPGQGVAMALAARPCSAACSSTPRRASSVTAGRPKGAVTAAATGRRRCARRAAGTGLAGRPQGRVRARVGGTQAAMAASRPVGAGSGRSGRQAVTGSRAAAAASARSIGATPSTTASSSGRAHRMLPAAIATTAVSTGGGLPLQSDSGHRAFTAAYECVECGPRQHRRGRSCRPVPHRQPHFREPSAVEPLAAVAARGPYRCDRQRPEPGPGLAAARRRRPGQQRHRPVQFAVPVAREDHGQVRVRPGRAAPRPATRATTTASPA